MLQRLRVRNGAASKMLPCSAILAGLGRQDSERSELLHGVVRHIDNAALYHSMCIWSGSWQLLMQRRRRCPAALGASDQAHSSCWCCWTGLLPAPRSAARASLRSPDDPLAGQRLTEHEAGHFGCSADSGAPARRSRCAGWRRCRCHSARCRRRRCPATAAATCRPPRRPRSPARPQPCSTCIACSGRRKSASGAFLPQ